MVSWIESTIEDDEKMGVSINVDHRVYLPLMFMVLIILIFISAAIFLWAAKDTIYSMK